MKTINELKQERQALAEEARSYLIDAEGNDKTILTEDEERQYADAMEKVKSLTEVINRRSAVEPYATIESGDRADGGEDRSAKQGDPELRALGEAIIEKRDYTAGMNTGVFKETVIDTKIREGLKVLSQVRSLCLVSSSGAREVIAVDNGDIDVEIVTETTDSPEQNGTLTPIEFNPYDMTGIVKMSKNALNDLPINVAENAINQFNRALAKKENLWHVVGTGSGQPQGILTGATLTKTVAGTGAITAAELKSFFTTLDSMVRANAYGWCHPETMEALQDLADLNKKLDIGWDSVLRSYRVLGVPFFTNSNMPKMEGGNAAIVVGDPNYYEIKDRFGVDLEVLRELYAKKRMVGYQFTRRSDAHVIESEAFVKLAMAGS